MFTYDINIDNFNRFDNSRHINHAMLLNQAVNIFNQARRASVLEKLKNVFFHANSLFDLESIPTGVVRNRRYGGIKPVSIASIRGTLGRTQDFDGRFNPLEDRIRDRWVSIAVARRRNIPLEPVALIEVNGYYFVKDGHHRISVARALGESAVDAEITIWDTCCALPWEAESARCAIPAPMS